MTEIQSYRCNCASSNGWYNRFKELIGNMRKFFGCKFATSVFSEKGRLTFWAGSSLKSTQIMDIYGTGLAGNERRRRWQNCNIQWVIRPNYYEQQSLPSSGFAANRNRRWVWHGFCTSFLIRPNGRKSILVRRSNWKFLTEKQQRYGVNGLEVYFIVSSCYRRNI